MSDLDKATRARFVAAGVLVASCPVLMWAFGRFGQQLFPAYRLCSKAIMGTLATVMSFAPCAVWDIGIVVLAVVTVVTLVRCIKKKQSLLPLLSTVCLAVACNLFLFVDCWALNHYAPPLVNDLGLKVSQYTTDELVDATAFYLRKAARLAPRVPRNHDDSLAKQDFYELASIAGASYEDLANTYPVFYGSTLPVKALLVWGEPLLYTGHTGMFWAPTGESGVPLNSAVADLPYIMCHEAAHRLGLASEQEANFAAFLACEASGDVRFAYSGYYNAFCYCLNALARTDPDRIQALLQEVVDEDLYREVILVLDDRTTTREHYQTYEGPVEDVGTAVNNTYLKSFGEDEGVRSYGFVVDYLIAWKQQSPDK